jgi:hypothetical protein
MDRILNKMYHNLTDDELGGVKDMFWTEWNEFSTKTGRYGDGRKYIWNSEWIRKRKSAQWHSQYSVAYTEVSLLWRLFLCVDWYSSLTAAVFLVVVVSKGTW